MINVFDRKFINILAVLICTSYALNSGLKTSNKLHHCIRTCRENEPMVCKYNFILEYYVTMGKSCWYCQPNGTYQHLYQIPECQCVFGDGYERGVLTINRMIPGPSIQVCYNDTIIVNVHNRMEGLDTTLHWHGIHQKESPFYDGVPFVTQCPIPGGSSFRYKFRADKPGTHFYHSHSSVQKLDGLYGSLIVRTPPEQDPHRNLYDTDLAIHTIVLSDFLHVVSTERIPGHTHSGTGQYPDTFLINGLGRYWESKTNTEARNPYEVVKVTSGRRHKLRIINGLGTTCDAQLTVENHTLTLIATDGNEFEPITVNTFVSYSGERFDLILEANQPPGSYWIQVFSKECFANKVQQLAILRYENDINLRSMTMAPSYDEPLPRGKIYSGSCDEEVNVCITDLRSLSEIKDVDIWNKSATNIYLPYELLYFEGQDPHIPNTYKHFIVPPSTLPITGLINGISFIFPSSPPLSQPNDIVGSRIQLCNPDNIPSTCPKNNCSCPYTLHVKRNEIAEMVLVDYSANRYSLLTHPFHLHGHSFYVMALGKLNPEWNLTMETMAPLIDEYRRNLETGNLLRPVLKDTVLIPHNGYAILRVKFNNPGYWFFHCHFAYHIVIGMNMIFHVGERIDLPAIPRNFPTCKDFLPGGRLHF